LLLVVGLFEKLEFTG